MREFAVASARSCGTIGLVSYTVFARKYRPQTFEEVIGQDHITRTLKNAIEQNRLAHAYIFVGPRGTGKTSTARILAKALNCASFPKPTTTPCGTCDTCTEIARGNSLDVLEFDAASNTQVDKIREIIIENVKFAPAHGRYKLYIVDEVHMLSASSFNALLKTLEEPPAHVKFVFATTDPQKVPTTILSRCQRFDLKRIPTALVRDHLLMIAGKEEVALTSTAAEAIARGAEGGMRDAESMLDQLVAFCGKEITEPDVLRVFGFTAQETIAQLAEHLLANDASSALRLVHEQGEEGRDFMRLLADLISHLRNLLVAKADAGALHAELSEGAVALVIEQAARIDMARLLELIEQFAGTEGRMKWAPNKKMHLEVAVIRAIQTLSQATLSEVLDALSAMRNGAPAPTPARAAAIPRAPGPARHPERSEPKASGVEGPGDKQGAAAQSRGPGTELPVAGGSLETPPGPSTPLHSAQDDGARVSAANNERPSAAEESLAEMDFTALWHALTARIRQDRPLLTSCVEAGALVEVSGERATVAFPPDQVLAIDLLESPNNRKFIESLLSAIARRPLTIKCVRREGLVVTAAPRAPEIAPEPPKSPSDDFKNDPLIQKALELFRAEIQPA